MTNFFCILLIRSRHTLSGKIILSEKIPILTLDPVHPRIDRISQAAKIIKEGGVVVFATQRLYGLAANAADSAAVQRVYELKHRPQNNPLLVLINHRQDLTRMVKETTLAAEILMDQFWPGDLTLVFQANATLSQVLTAHTGKIGIRLPRHPVAQALVQAVGFPVTGTSANLSGRPGCSDLQDLDPELLAGVDLVLDAGSLNGGLGSTVVDTTMYPVRIIREGAVAAANIQKALETPASFICTQK